MLLMPDIWSTEPRMFRVPVVSKDRRFAFGTEQGLPEISELPAVCANLPAERNRKLNRPFYR
jgi:hypothetical protein